MIATGVKDYMRVGTLIRNTLAISNELDLKIKTG
jgi:hypothetical protein